jgi:FkbM family methyltransferase
MKSVYRLFQSALSHPIGSRSPVRTVNNILLWQMRSRLSSRPICHRWVDDAVLMVRHGMTGATGNIYVGLHEFPDMGFVAHFLRPDDLFVDIGSNVGSYTVLGAAVRGARTICFEPDPETVVCLRENIAANDIGARVTVHQMALGAFNGTVSFTRGLDTVNHVAEADDRDVRTVPIARLDDVLAGHDPALIKLDVEGYEASVLEGAAQTLANPSLMAIEAETVDRRVSDIFEANGFVRRFYDPFHRRLGAEPFGHRSHNSLFVRNEAVVCERLSAAPPISVAGMRL